jgi:hypothetical protein
MAEFTTSEKVKVGIIRRGIMKSWLAPRLNMTRPTLDSRIKNDNWEPEDITLLKQHGILI